MLHVKTKPETENRKLLVDRIAQSRYIAKSARLCDLLVYLTGRVLDQGALEIHEQEAGHEVFGRAADYDIVLDNIVRVHASTLRNHRQQYFAEEGSAEPVTLELPKGNYAPVFRERTIETPADGYCSVALLPNRGGTGSVLLLSSTGGAASTAAGAFLLDGTRMAELRSRLTASPNGAFPYFEALLKIPNRSRLAKDAQILVCRKPKT